jgi:uncharacterized membrane protein YoaK (UPF0700 family)
LPKEVNTKLPQTTLSEVSGPLAVACVFTAAGGYMDAYAYLAHGHVFANAQTGNFIFFAVYATAGDWAQASRHVPPIVAFALGVAVANLLGVHPEKHTYRATLFCQAFELAILGVLAVSGSRLPDASVVPLIAFVAAVQNTSFDRIGQLPFNSAITTSNLRSAVTAWVLWLKGEETAENRSKAIALSMICGSFLAGALGGASFTRPGTQHALVPCVAIVAAGFLLTWRLRQKANPVPATSEPAI